MIEKLEEAVKTKGVRVFISRHTCSLVEMNELRQKQMKPSKVEVDPEKCKGCLLCVNQFGCPSIQFDEKTNKAFIDEESCRGCNVCIEVCIHNAICQKEDN
jgi:indolepyruvate ferredoxin oxidoreductase alpha subunit